MNFHELQKPLYGQNIQEEALEFGPERKQLDTRLHQRGKVQAQVIQCGQGSILEVLRGEGSQEEEELSFDSAS